MVFVKLDANIVQIKTVAALVSTLIVPCPGNWWGEEARAVKRSSQVSFQVVCF